MMRKYFLSFVPYKDDFVTVFGFCGSLLVAVWILSGGLDKIGSEEKLSRIESEGRLAGCVGVSELANPYSHRGSVEESSRWLNSWIAASKRKGNDG